MNARSMVLWGGLALTALLAFWPRPQDDASAVVGVAERHARSPSPAERFPALDGDLFPSQTWARRAPPPVVRHAAEPTQPATPEPVMPPDFPFAYFGHWDETAGRVHFLRLGDQLLKVGPGDVVAGEWRLERIEGDTMVFTYLPMGMEKTMRIY